MVLSASMNNSSIPSLFGLKNSNHDFSKARSWGKNIFNNAFPAALTCYFNSIGLQPVYIVLNEIGETEHRKIDVDELFDISTSSETTFFAFESDFPTYRPLVVDTLPRADLVMMNIESGISTRALEIKLTALPDNSTYHLADDQFGCELVVRPDTILYLALSIASEFQHQRDTLKNYLSDLPTIDDWTDIQVVSPNIPVIASVLDQFFIDHLTLQKPLILQPIWKTQGKSLILHEDTFDIFVWSDFAFTRLFFRDRSRIQGKPTRGARTITWLAKMLLDFANTGKINHHQIIDSMSFNTKNDKAFAVNGRVTQPYMQCPELLKPRVKKLALKDIILGGGEQFLSPERRLDAAILSTAGVFD